MKKRTVILCVVIVVIVLGLLFQDNLIRSYVSLCSTKLENYAVKVLESSESTSGSYGIWKTKCYPEDTMVEFWTGAWGLAPSSTYKGFYYSADNTHKLFSAAYEDSTSLEINGDHASWTDGTDNHGTSIRITEKWFWFEASF